MKVTKIFIMLLLSSDRTELSRRIQREISSELEGKSKRIMDVEWDNGKNRASEKFPVVYLGRMTRSSLIFYKIKLLWFTNEKMLKAMFLFRRSTTKIATHTLKDDLVLTNELCFIIVTLHSFLHLSIFQFIRHSSAIARLKGTSRSENAFGLVISFVVRVVKQNNGSARRN